MTHFPGFVKEKLSGEYGNSIYLEGGGERRGRRGFLKEAWQELSNRGIFMGLCAAILFITSTDISFFRDLRKG